MVNKLIKLNAILRLYHQNFLNLHWNSAGEEFNDAHKSISTDYYELCDKYIDTTAEMICRLGGNPLNYIQVVEFLTNQDSKYFVTDSSKMYERKDIIKWSDVMLGDILKNIEEVLEDDEAEDSCNIGIKSDLEAMHSEFDLQYRYINKRRMM